MIGALFTYFDEVVEVIVQGCNVFFRTSSSGGKFATIDGLKLDRAGVIREFPELEFDNEWRSKAIIKFKDKIKSLPDELSRIRYVIEDLRMKGYIPKYIQKEGFRPEAIK